MVFCVNIKMKHNSIMFFFHNVNNLKNVLTILWGYKPVSFLQSVSSIRTLILVLMITCLMSTKRGGKKRQYSIEFTKLGEN